MRNILTGWTAVCSRTLRNSLRTACVTASKTISPMPVTAGLHGKASCRVISTIHTTLRLGRRWPSVTFTIVGNWSGRGLGLPLVGRDQHGPEAVTLAPVHSVAGPNSSRLSFFLHDLYNLGIIPSRCRATLARPYSTVPAICRLLQACVHHWTCAGLARMMNVLPRLFGDFSERLPCSDYPCKPPGQTTTTTTRTSQLNIEALVHRCTS